MPDTPLLECRELHHRFAGSPPVLGGLSLIVNPRETVAILGESGCGKTTLLRIIAGLLQPQQGQVLMSGALASDGSQNHIAPQHRGIGYLFQDYALFPSLSVRGNVEFGIRAARDDRQRRASEMLAMTGLSELESRAIDQLSGGQQQRVALARALAVKPSLVLLDEPFSNVDADQRQTLGQEVIGLIRASGAGALLVTHDRAEALSLADRVALCMTGPVGATITQIDRPEAVYLRPLGVRQATMTGPCSAITIGSEPWRKLLSSGQPALAPGAPAQATHLIVRPESFSLRADGEGAWFVQSYRFFGGSWLVKVADQATASTVSLEVRYRGDGPPQHNARVSLVQERPLWAVCEG